MADKMSTSTRVEEILAEWTLDQTLTTSDRYLSPQDTITVSGRLDTMNTSPYTFNGSVGTNFPNAVFTATSATTAPWMTSNGTGARIQLDGETADITVNGWSLVDAVKRIEQRLGLYQPNPELEQEWSDLRDLAEQYRALEQHIQDKQATFDRLRAMPAPDID